MDFKNCTLRVLTHFWPPHVVSPHGKRADSFYLENSEKSVEFTNLTEGIEIKLIRTFAEKMNFSILFRWVKRCPSRWRSNWSLWIIFCHIECISVNNQQRWGQLFDNKSGIGGLGSLLKGEGDIFFGAVVSHHSLHEVFDSSTPYLWVEYIKRKMSKSIRNHNLQNIHSWKSPGLFRTDLTYRIGWACCMS